MQIDAISDGIVLDHIKAGKAMELYELLGLSQLECSVAIIKNADSKKMGKKDIIKIDQVINIDFDIIGYIDPEITVNVIANGKLTKHTHIDLPDKLVNVIKCRNPRCITSIEQELPHVFRLVDRANRIYRCLYCESQPQIIK